MNEMKGVTFLHSETGTEGGWWAMQEDGFADKDGSWSYEGLRDLEEGDDFTVYADDGSVLFHSVIHRDTETGAIPRQLIRNGKLVNDRNWKQQVVGVCGCTGCRKAWTPKPGAPCSSGKGAACLGVKKAIRRPRSWIGCSTSR
jgi:hypothetical protein